MKQDRARVNSEIRAQQVRVIDDDGSQLGVFLTSEAIRVAQGKGMDLIEIVPKATPPVCKIMDFGKYKYEQAKRDKLQKKHQHTTQLKEIRFHPTTDTHDFEFKTLHAREFIEQGHKVKATVVFRGRQITYQDHGRELLNRFTERLSDIAKVEMEARMEGRQMVCVYSGDKTRKKAETKNKGETNPKEEAAQQDGTSPNAEAEQQTDSQQQPETKQQESPKG